MAEILTLTLEWTGKGLNQTAVFYEGETYYVGRDSACEIILDDERVSRRQMEIKESDGYFYIKNIGRGGPIVAHNQAMANNQRARLAKDAIIEIANQFRIRVVDLKATDALKIVICPSCQRRVDQATNDCRWCGQNLAGAPTLYA